MKPHLKGLAFAVMLTLCWSGGPSWGQKPPAVLPPNPLAPVLAPPMPLGAKPGTVLDLTLTGSNLAGPTGLLLSFPAKVTIPNDKKNGTEPGTLRVRLEVPADAPLGYHTIQLATTQGMSNLRVFCVDDLPTVAEVATNRKKETPQVLPVPCTLAGRTDNEQPCYFKFSVKPGQRLTFDVLGHRLGSTIDPEMTLYDAKSMRELAHQNDSPGCQSDCRLTHVFKEGGDYLLEIKDVLNRGGADFFYRLRVGDFPNATMPIPMAAKRGSTVNLQFAGPMVDGVAPLAVTVPQDPSRDVLWIAPKGANGLHGWPVALALTDHDELVEQEPNNEPAKAQAIPVPGGVTGRLMQSSDVDFYRFTAKKGQKLVIDAETLELYSPTLIYMAVKNAKTNAELAKTNPEAPPPADQRIDFTAPEDGDYLVEIQHLNLAGGPSEAYHLTIRPSAPDFDLSLNLDRFDLAGNSPLPLTILANRRGYAGPIDISLAGAGGMTGTATIPAGQASTTLIVTAKPDLPMGPFRAALSGKAMIDGKAVIRPVSVRQAVTQSMGNLLFPPRNFNSQIALAIREKAPFELIARMEQPEVLNTATAKLVIQAKRQPGFDDAITLAPPIGLPANVAVPKIAAIAKGQAEIKVDVPLNPKAPLGEYLIIVNGKAKHMKRDFQGNSQPAKLVLTLPFELKVEPAALKLLPGQKTKLKITAQRKAGYQGPIALEVRKLPAGVTASKGAIPMGQAALELEVTVAPNAAPATAGGIDVLGTATAAGNQQAATSPFTVTIGKK